MPADFGAGSGSGFATSTGIGGVRASAVAAFIGAGARSSTS
ncbi:hypothetical protein [Phenylobacterium sp. J367]|nr:hypothetical protein [Phenylobacterium sp. J367]